MSPGLSVRQWLEHATSVRGLPIDIPHVAIERQFQTALRSESYQIVVIPTPVGDAAARRDNLKRSHTMEFVVLAAGFGRCALFFAEFLSR
jgi:hypothetical protein